MGRGKGKRERGKVWVRFCTVKLTREEMEEREEREETPSRERRATKERLVG